VFSFCRRAETSISALSGITIKCGPTSETSRQPSGNCDASQSGLRRQIWFPWSVFHGCFHAGNIHEYPASIKAMAANYLKSKRPRREGEAPSEPIYRGSDGAFPFAASRRETGPTCQRNSISMSMGTARPFRHIPDFHSVFGRARQIRIEHSGAIYLCISTIGARVPSFTDVSPARSPEGFRAKLQECGVAGDESDIFDF
jgi:hypothetical protein